MRVHGIDCWFACEQRIRQFMASYTFLDIYEMDTLVSFRDTCTIFTIGWYQSNNVVLSLNCIYIVT